MRPCLSTHRALTHFSSATNVTNVAYNTYRPRGPDAGRDLGPLSLDSASFGRRPDPQRSAKIKFPENEQHFHYEIDFKEKSFLSFALPRDRNNNDQRNVINVDSAYERRDEGKIRTRDARLLNGVGGTKRKQWDSETGKRRGRNALSTSELVKGED